MKTYLQYITEGEIDSAESVFLYLVKNNKINQLKEWIKKGYDINRRNDPRNGNTFTPLMQNCADETNENVEMLQTLLDLGADINIKDDLNRTALWYASHNGHVKSVFILLNAGADPLPVDKNGKDFYDVLPHNDSVRSSVKIWLQKNNPSFLDKRDHTKRFDL